MLKVLPASGYPPEEGRYLRGNDYSPVAVVVILIHDQEKIPPDIENLVRVGVETGLAIRRCPHRSGAICFMIREPIRRHRSQADSLGASLVLRLNRKTRLNASKEESSES